VAFVFPTNPNIGDLVTNPNSGQIFRWNGFAWGGDSANALLTASFAFTASYLLGGEVPSSSYSESSSYVLLEDVATGGNYRNDALAGAAGIPIGGLYRNGNFVQIRIS
jgi:hypothetical protein